MWFFNYSNLVDPLLKDIRVSVVGFSGTKIGDKILDVCCGTGDQAFHFARNGVVSYGIDLDPNMIRLAEESKRKSGLDNVFFQIADARNLPFEDNFFDCASISLALHEKKSETRDKIVCEMKRVVKKGGSLIFIDFKVPLPKNIYSCLIRTVEYFAGENHYECFKDYLEQAGLGKILERNQLNAEEKDYTRNGIIEIIKVKN
jgi:ubiquinone/menaquinone biosynthesis C-methylase UbiE